MSDRAEGRNEGNGTAGGVGEREGGNVAFFPAALASSAFGTTAVRPFFSTPPSESESESDDESDSEDESSLPSSDSEDACSFPFTPACVFCVEAETGATVSAPALLFDGPLASLASESESDDEDSLDDAALLFLFLIRFLGAGGLLEAAGAIVVGCREKAELGNGRNLLPHSALGLGNSPIQGDGPAQHCSSTYCAYRQLMRLLLDIKGLIMDENVPP